YATAPGKVAADGEGANGLYTQELLKALSQPGLKVEDVFKQVRIGVARASGGSQVPWEASSLTGDFYFQPPVAVAAPAPVIVPPLDREAIFWDSVKLSNDPAELRAYLDAFPNGMFAGIARARVASLETARQSQVAAVSAVPAQAPTSAPAAAAPVVAAPAQAPPRQQAPQQIVAVPAVRANGISTDLLGGNVPIGILVPQGAYIYLRVYEGAVTFTASETFGVGRQNPYRCYGKGDLDGPETFSNIEIECELRTSTVKATASGVMLEGGRVKVSFESANGKKADVVFR
ncbi:MAG: caspase family protein, partial [Telmatospirillum sp.]|nr:caspase family protein [Telmatospirillum sp.]